MDRRQILEALKIGEGSALRFSPVPVEQRRGKLRLFRKLLNKNREEICRALGEDLRRPAADTLCAEWLPLMESLSRLISRLPALSGGKRIPESLFTFPAMTKVIPEPYGRALVIGAWNYPFLLSLEPAIGAYSAGNRVILKLSPRCTRSMHLVHYLLEQCFSSEEILVIEDELSFPELLSFDFDFYFCTGNREAGSAVLHAAAARMAPSILELGGKNPCIVSRNANLKTAADRIVRSKFFNAGQSCIAPDLLLADRTIKPELMRHITSSIRKHYGTNPLSGDACTAVPDAAAYDRACRLLAKGRLICGGDKDPRRFLLEPTVIDQLPADSPLLHEEIFAPILPVVEFSGDQEAMATLASFRDPLAAYCFGGSRELREFLTRIFPAGAVVFNDCMLHFLNPAIPFGGIGKSGMGQYHGELDFLAFSHLKPVMKRPGFLHWPPRWIKSEWFFRVLAFRKFF